MGDMPFRKQKAFIEEHEQTNFDANGNKIASSKSTITRYSDRNYEPDYIKLYIKPLKRGQESTVDSVDCELYQVPEFARRTFLQLAIRMHYCNAGDLRGSQKVDVRGTNKIEIMEACGIKNDQVWYRHIKALVDCDAIRPIIVNGKRIKGEYQINPHIVGRGQWLYSVRDDKGGLRDFVNYWDANNNMQTNIVYAADGNNPRDAELFGLRDDEQRVWTESSTLLDDFPVSE